MRSSYKQANEGFSFKTLGRSIRIRGIIQIKATTTQRAFPFQLGSCRSLLSHSVAQSSGSAVQYYQSPSFTCKPCFPTVCLYQKDANNSFQIQIQYLRRPKGRKSKSEKNQPTLPKKPKVFTKAPRDRGLCFCYYQGLGNLE